MVLLKIRTYLILLWKVNFDPEYQHVVFDYAYNKASGMLYADRKFRKRDVYIRII